MSHKVCIYCDKAGRKNAIFVECSECARLYHRTCLLKRTKITDREINVYRKRNNFVCWTCTLPLFNDSFWSISEPPPRPPRQSRATSAEENEAVKILSFNARSMKNRKTVADNFALFEHHDADICAINETWLAPEIKNHEFVPREYVVLRKDRLGGRRAAGGVLMAIRPHLQPRRLQHLEGDAEIVWASVRAGRLRLLVGSAYRRPNADQEYNSALLRSLECVARQQHNYDGVLLMGDFNLDIKWDVEPPVIGVQPAEAFIDAFAEMSFAQFVKTATRTTNTSAKIIDLLLCDVPALVADAHVVPGTSDHEAVVAKLAVSVQKPISAPTRVPNFQRANWPFLSQVLEQRLDCVSSEEDVITAWEMWKKILFDAVEELVPTKKVGGRRKKKHPWMTKALKQLISIRDELFGEWRCAGTDEKRQVYLNARRSTRAAIRAARDEWLWRLGLGKSHSKELWRYINSKAKVPFEASIFEIDGRTVTSAQEIAEKFSEIFQSNFARAQTFPYVRRNAHATSTTAQFRGLQLAPAHVQFLLQRIKTAAPGCDGITAPLLKNCAAALSSSLCHIFQRSISSGEIPADWKTAAVTPLYKDGPKEDVQNYRPISVTSLVGKVMERIVRDQLTEFLEAKDVFPASQHGFRVRRSCTTLLTGLFDAWTAILDERSGSHVHAILLDLSKAFDRVPHGRLLSKMQHYGVGGDVLRWLECFLTGRTQHVKYGGACSSPAEVLSGVVQGSVLGPMLFNVFIADLPKDISSGFEQYADDTTLWRVVTSPEDADALQNDLDRVYIWCENNGMMLNQRKSYAMDITRARTPLYFEYTINGAPIEYVNKQRLLGVQISSDLRWDVHTDAVRAKAARVLSFAARNLRGCTQRVKRVAYLSLVKPILTFGLPAWHPTTQANTTKLERVQRRALRFIHGRRPPPPQEANVMPIQMHLNYTDLNFFKKCEGGAIDFNHRARIIERRQLRGDANERHQRLQPPPVRSVFGQRAFSFRVVQPWNDLPPELKECTVAEFPSLCKKHLWKVNSD